MGNLTFRSFCLLLLSLTLGSFGQICMKAGLHGDKIPISHSIVTTFANVAVVLLRKWVIVGLALYVLSTFTWLLLISRVRLSVAYPMISISYVMVMLLSAWILCERIEWHFAIAGLLLIGGGVSFIGLGMGQAQTSHDEVGG